MRSLFALFLVTLVTITNNCIGETFNYPISRLFYQEKDGAYAMVSEDKLYAMVPYSTFGRLRVGQYQIHIQKVTVVRDLKTNETSSVTILVTDVANGMFDEVRKGHFYRSEAVVHLTPDFPIEVTDIGNKVYTQPQRLYGPYISFSPQMKALGLRDAREKD